eukprot:Cvel_29577.t1-p1 / transcript=Cvel_29577.t1 / gene=Cvel_29577 / organism=Chromera_velia_CCMP2878 / gene_product=hypothetical protein / transcript_product=hypothetical protein / location=Cvel_scaffold4070:1-379(-) / protein_length=126 / sequence_SO=supercontig / SO=protein_coding / is_pseudo=false
MGGLGVGRENGSVTSDLRSGGIVMERIEVSGEEKDEMDALMGAASAAPPAAAAAGIGVAPALAAPISASISSFSSPDTSILSITIPPDRRSDVTLPFSLPTPNPPIPLVIGCTDGFSICPLSPPSP